MDNKNEEKFKQLEENFKQLEEKFKQLEEKYENLEKNITIKFRIHKNEWINTLKECFK